MISTKKSGGPKLEHARVEGDRGFNRCQVKKESRKEEVRKDA